MMATFSYSLRCLLLAQFSFQLVIVITVDCEYGAEYTHEQKKPAPSGA